MGLGWGRSGRGWVAGACVRLDGLAPRTRGVEGWVGVEGDVGRGVGVVPVAVGQCGAVCCGPSRAITGGHGSRCSKHLTDTCDAAPCEPLR